jgi:hypothetical protein
MDLSEGSECWAEKVLTVENFTLKYHTWALDDHALV